MRENTTEVRILKLTKQKYEAIRDAFRLAYGREGIWAVIWEQLCLDMTPEEYVQQRNATLRDELCYIGPSGAYHTRDEICAKYRELVAKANAGDKEASAQLDLFDWLDHDLMAIHDTAECDPSSERDG